MVYLKILSPANTEGNHEHPQLRQPRFSNTSLESYRHINLLCIQHFEEGQLYSWWLVCYRFQNSRVQGMSIFD